MSDEPKHLWEFDHPYYCAEEGYYYNSHQVQGWGAPAEYRTFDEFLDEWRDSDLDMNLVFRWDWERKTVEEYEEDYGDKPHADRLNGAGNSSELKIFMMMQRKGCKKVITVTHMEDSDEDAVRAFLGPRWEHMKRLWGGVSEAALAEKGATDV